MLATGGVYALVALGYTLVFGVIRLVNFAHCDVMMLGAYFGYIAVSFWGISPAAAILVAMAGCGAMGMLLERLVYRPLRRSPGEYLLIAAIGASLILEYGAMLIFSSKPRMIPMGSLDQVVHWGNAVLSKTKLTVLAVSLVLMLALTLLLKYTRLGIAMRAVSNDRKAALLCGVNENRVISFAFFVGSALAGAAGVFYGGLFSLSPLMGMAPGLKAFSAAVLGGIGSIPGAVLGGFLLSFFESASAIFISSAVKDAVSFLMMIAVLLVLPGGITNSKSDFDRI